ncbi:MAG: SpoIVB peptidase S55 domain-containing protein [Clostridia bacterium]|nr:SpoIVB peptidase S55 domain-containing protein [Clostridia bacterium]
MKKIIKFLTILPFALIISLFNVSNARAESEKIYLGGCVAGFSITTEGAEVVGICDVITNDGVKSPAKHAGIIIGDIILEIGDLKTNNANDVAAAIKDGDNKPVKVKRAGETFITKVVPEKDMTGIYKLGVFIRDDINGMGTITFFNEKEFAALGHPVISPDGNVMKITGGKIFNCNVTGAVKGERGKAGELKGVFVGEPYGVIEKNTLTGVYGNVINKNGFNLKEIGIGEGVVGDASIYSTVNGEGVKEYKISIVKVDKDNKSNKNFVIKTNDKNLIEQTGGIVQGMSGSPIVQNGKLIGAVTHVFINDPTRGFAISISKMLEK